MGQSVRTTIYFHPRLYRALRIKAAESGETLSNLVGRALVESLREDEIDLEAFDKRKQDRSRPLRAVLDDLRRDGLL
ncbi:MAG: CopG family transcriptional regulator [Terriglobia bacterium]